jgi:hypothetical protein
MDGARCRDDCYPTALVRPKPTLTLTISAISRDHCKSTIEGKAGAMPGAVSMEVNVASRTAVVSLSPPAARSGIESVLSGSGNPPQVG